MFRARADLRLRSGFFRLNHTPEASSALSLDPALPISLQQALTSPRFPELSISYFSHGLPTFALCPAQLDQLQIFHGSCRNVQDRDHDALAIVDCAAAHHAAQPNHRPHQLFFTGDQIYGDEVADPFLWAILRAQDAIFNEDESLVIENTEPFDLSQALQPGQRNQIATQTAGLTASLKNTPEKASSHLFRFGEYCVAYLFSWSQCLWQLDFPQASDLGQRGKQAKQWDRDVIHLKRNSQSQHLVRRALANVPTYMIFDDHDVSDDWNINQAWCQRVLGSSMGYQVVRNAMLAYALFQGWGNTPEQFARGTVGAELLKATETWCETGDRAAAFTLTSLLGIPPQKQLFRPDGDTWVLNSASASLKWHYAIEGTNHRIWVLDTRTQRGYPQDKPPTRPPQLISPSGFKAQLGPLQAESSGQPQLDSTAGPIRLTFIVAPTNVFTLEVLDWLQSLALKSNRVFDADVGDSWNLETSSRAKLLSCLFDIRRPVVILSGDIHFGASIEVDYQINNPAASHNPSATLSSDSIIKGRLTQLTASAICNSDTMTGLLHTKLKSLLPERSRSWLGWNQPALQVEVTSIWQAHLRRPWLKLRQRFPSAKALSPEEQLLVRDRLPSWQYQTTWMKRQPARRSIWLSSSPPWLTSSGRSGLHSKLTKWLWYNRWLQEGHEVVGFNNIGLVHFEYRGDKADLVVLHDLYWYSPWRASQVIYSRFESNIARNSGAA